MRNSRNGSIPSVLTGLLILAACGDSPTEPGANGQQGAVVGRIESTGSAAPMGFAPASSAHSGNGITVAVARVQADGGLDALATASAAADGSYRIEQVPAGTDRLVVVATADGGAEVGRVILHQAVAANATVTAAPINAETSVEARVFAELIASGMAKEEINTVELAQSIDFRSGATAGAVLASDANVQALADGFRARQSIYTQVLASRGVSLDARARFQTALDAAIELAEQLHAGAEARAAEASAATDVAAAYRAAGANARVQVEASSAAETGLLRAGEVADAQARLDVASAAVSANLLAREQLIAELLAALGVGAAQALEAQQIAAEAKAAIESASSVEALADIMAEVSVRLQAVFETHLVASGRVPQAALDLIEAAFEGLPGQADLEARLAAAASADAIASAYVSFYADLRGAVQAAVTQLVAAGGDVDGAATADLFTGLRGYVHVQ